MQKVRLDVMLVSRGLAESREKAKAMIMTGNVFVKNERVDKAGQAVPEDSPIEIRGNPLKYVSRGGYKLERAIENFSVSLSGKVCIDVGSSTGGFTDCMLQNGAIKVFAIDVGTNQLAWKLRSDSRVTVMEKTNIRYVVPEDMEEKADFISVDVAFISLTKVLLPVKHLLNEEGEIVLLIKPQFEAGREKIGKKGVVSDKETHEEVIKTVMDYAGRIGFRLRGLDYSPIRGPEGNIEYLLYISSDASRETDESAVRDHKERQSKTAEQNLQIKEQIKEIVKKAHESI